MDTADKEAAIAQFLREHPQVGPGVGHRALHGCDEIAWGEIPGCPAEIPVLLHGLLDRTAGLAAAHALPNILMDSVFHLSPATPTALPFLIRLAGATEEPVRAALLDFLDVVAKFSQAVDPDDESMVLIFGSDGERPERERCRAVLAEHADLIRTLLDGTSTTGPRACLRRTAGLL
ncbi:hypothetical protein [Allokutzneria sp. NRRL B-24872]|uniref:hypothetical protein n=1 Tax=Allokutzneria sp. NRRL B-24872 TaxID=1137961 RepID=UPI0011777084|nr:hypothetical protein [Allokutzneria sp. NRRL B-24872]